MRSHVTPYRQSCLISAFLIIANLNFRLRHPRPRMLQRNRVSNWISSQCHVVSNRVSKRSILLKKERLWKYFTESRPDSYDSESTVRIFYQFLSSTYNNPYYLKRIANFTVDRTDSSVPRSIALQLSTSSWRSLLSQARRQSRERFFRAHVSPRRFLAHKLISAAWRGECWSFKWV